MAGDEHGHKIIPQLLAGYIIPCMHTATEASCTVAAVNYCSLGACKLVHRPHVNKELCAVLHGSRVVYAKFTNAPTQAQFKSICYSFVYHTANNSCVEPQDDKLMCHTCSSLLGEVLQPESVESGSKQEWV